MDRKSYRRGDEILREDCPPGDGFLAEVCRQWETAAEPASQRGNPHRPPSPHLEGALRHLLEDAHRRRP